MAGRTNKRQAGVSEASSLATSLWFGFRTALLGVCLLTLAGCGKKSGLADGQGAAPKTATTTLETPEEIVPLPDLGSGAVTGPASEVQPERIKPIEPAKVYRRSDDRVVVNAGQLEGTDIRRYESKRLILYTDLDPAIAETLPNYADELYAALVEFFGELPPNREGTEFQVTGYLMVNRKSFRENGLRPRRVPQFNSGRHLGYEFWLFDQTKEYYRRHLLLHEFTHCFMTCVTGTDNAPPAWYMEGTAEFFATHRITPQGTQFGVMPENREDYAGHDRIMSLNLVPADARKSMADVREIAVADTMLYPWAWAKCVFLMNHPATCDQFKAIGTHLTRAEFVQRWEPIERTAADHLAVEWAFFTDQLCTGYDLSRGATQFAEGQPLEVGASIEAKIGAAKGWQSSQVSLVADGVYKIEATGQFQVNDQPRPWISEADGVSIEYVRDNRLGCLLGTVFDKPDSMSLTRQFAVGSNSKLANREGTLYLRINDRMNSLANNAGELAVKITRVR